MDTPNGSSSPQPPVRPDFERTVPPGDNAERLVCRRCGWIHYENPRVVVSAVAEWEGRILLCRRAIAPRVGHWTVPGGFMEIAETAPEGAIRETLEETGASIEIRDLLAVYSLPHIGQVHLVYRARLLAPHIETGAESLEVRLYEEDAIPWDDLAFPTNEWALRHYLRARGEELLVPFTEPVD